MNGIEKWMPPFRMGTTSYTTVQNLGEIVQRAPAVGVKIWCLYVCFCHAPRPARCSFEGVYFEYRFYVAVYGLILMPFFSERIALSEG